MPTIEEMVPEYLRKISDIVRWYLKENGYDGLYYEECGCEIDDLFPCGEPSLSCAAGYRNNCETCVCVTHHKTTEYKCPYDLADEDNCFVVCATKCCRKE